VQKALGAQVTTMPATDINQAMDRGIIDGFCYTLFAAQNYTYYESAKYIVDRGFFKGEAPLVMNLEKWNKLPKEVQDVLIKKGAEMEEFFYKYAEDQLVKDRSFLKEKGVQFIKFSPEDEKKFDTTCKEAGWAKVKERCPGSYEKLRDLLVKK
jgi:TRAP-type C4-dicarboxylate transport system substrate-binding protein